MSNCGMSGADLARRWQTAGIMAKKSEGRASEPGGDKATPGQLSAAAQPHAGELLTESRQLPLTLTMLLWLLLAIFVGAVAFVGFGRIVSGEWNPWDNKRKPDLYDLARSTVAVTGLLGAAVAAGIATRRQRSNEREVDISRRTHLLAAETYALELRRDAAEATRSLRERYGAAAAQLGHQAPPMRLAGVYAMAALADDWLASGRSNLAEARSCIEVLAGYLRTPHPADEPGTPSNSAAEREVRQTIVRVITAHLQPHANPSWSWCDYDFTGATFSGDTSFAGSRFDGRVTFENAQFQGRRVSFERVRFAKPQSGQSRVSFERTDFDCQTVSYASSVFERPVDFSAITFSEGASFTNVEVRADTRFTDCRFQPSANLTLYGAEIYRGAKLSFRTCQFSGVAIFDGAILHGGNIVFEDCGVESRVALVALTMMDNSTVSFSGDTVLGAQGRIELTDSTIESGVVSITDADMQGGTVDLTGTRFGTGRFVVNSDFSQTRMIGPWGEQFIGEWPAASSPVSTLHEEE